MTVAVSPWPWAVVAGTVAVRPRFDGGGTSESESSMSMTVGAWRKRASRATSLALAPESLIPPPSESLSMSMTVGAWRERASRSTESTAPLIGRMTDVLYPEIGGGSSPGVLIVATTVVV